MLAHHDLFRKLAGNPHSISVLSSLYANLHSGFKLADLYNQMKSDKFKELIDGHAFDNEISLKISSETVLDFVTENHPEAHKFFYFLSMFPCGAKQTMLASMWGPSADKCTEILQKYSIVEIDKDARRRLTPYFMTLA